MASRDDEIGDLIQTTEPEAAILTTSSYHGLSKALCNLQRHVGWRCHDLDSRRRHTTVRQLNAATQHSTACLEVGPTRALHPHHPTLADGRDLNPAAAQTANVVHAAIIRSHGPGIAGSLVDQKDGRAGKRTAVNSN